MNDYIIRATAAQGQSVLLQLQQKNLQKRQERDTIQVQWQQRHWDVY